MDVAIQSVATSVKGKRDDRIGLGKSVTATVMSDIHAGY
jgi:hypothetical protein